MKRMFFVALCVSPLPIESTTASSLLLDCFSWTKMAAFDGQRQMSLGGFLFYAVSWEFTPRMSLCLWKIK
jgi:hypothetical protein